MILGPIKPTIQTDHNIPGTAQTNPPLRHLSHPPPPPTLPREWIEENAGNCLQIPKCQLNTGKLWKTLLNAVFVLLRSLYHCLSHGCLISLYLAFLRERESLAFLNERKACERKMLHLIAVKRQITLFRTIYRLV